MKKKRESSNVKRVEGESRLLSGYVGRHFVAAPKHWGLEWVWPALSLQSKELLAHQRRLTMAWVPIMGGLTVFSVYLYHTERVVDRAQPTAAGGEEP